MSDLDPNNTEEEGNKVIFTLWAIGLVVSTLCLIIQIVFFALIPASRKLDQKILTQISVARLLNTFTEFVITHVTGTTPMVRDLSYYAYMHTDAALFCWMFVFSKNLYDKVTRVFVLHEYRFVLVSLLVWLITMPEGIVCPILLNYDFDKFITLYHVHGIIKFIVLTVNILFFIRIFTVAISRKKDKNFKSVMKTCVISFVLITIASLQVLTTDLLSFFVKTNDLVTNGFCVFNSFQLIAITAIFIILVQGSSDESLWSMFSRRLRRLSNDL